MSDRIPDGHLFLDAEGLMSKWGFSDGAVFTDWWWDRFDEPPPFDDGDVLHGLVLAHLVPALREAGHEVEIERIATSHNPVRARTLDGREVDQYALDDRLDPPVWVTISPEQVDEIVRRVVVTEPTDPAPRRVCSCWRLRPDGSHGKGCDFYIEPTDSLLDDRIQADIDAGNLPREWLATESTDLDAGPSGSGHSPRATGRDVGDRGGSVEEPSTHLIHGPASAHESSVQERAVAIFERRMGFAYTDEYEQSREWSDAVAEATEASDPSGPRACRTATTSGGMDGQGAPRLRLRRGRCFGGRITNRPNRRTTRGASRSQTASSTITATAPRCA